MAGFEGGMQMSSESVGNLYGKCIAACFLTDVNWQTGGVLKIMKNPILVKPELNVLSEPFSPFLFDSLCLLEKVLFLLNIDKMLSSF